VAGRDAAALAQVRAGRYQLGRLPGDRVSPLAGWQAGFAPPPLFSAHSVKALARNIPGFAGISPVHETLIGGADGLGTQGSQRWWRKLGGMGRLAK